MRKYYCAVILFLADIFCVYLACVLAVESKLVINAILGFDFGHELFKYTHFYFIYAVVIAIFCYHGMYFKRYDFWHESYLIVKSCVLALAIVFCLLALSKDISRSRTIICLIFLYTALLVPMIKLALKLFLFYLGLWGKKARVLNSTKEFRKEIFKNHYLGYKISRFGEYETLFISSQNLDSSELNTLIESNILANKEIIFMPVLGGYNFSNATILSLFNSRTNLFVIKNSLLSPFKRFLKQASDIIIVLLALPFLLIAFFVIFVLIKLEEPKGSVIFSQKRVGQGGAMFSCYKFRTMRENSEEFFSNYLKEHPEELEFYKKYHKYENDPRITKIGAFLRKTSLDELPQLINVIKGQMSIVGPRPLIKSELDEVKELDLEIRRSVKPGITGLAQVTGRSDSNPVMRREIDVWYVKNWSIYIDIIVILKTIKIVLLRKGAY